MSDFTLPAGWSAGEEIHYCGGKKCHGVYQCAHCLRWCGWCFGADDDIERAMGPICDDCAYVEAMGASHAR